MEGWFSLNKNLCNRIIKMQLLNEFNKTGATKKYQCMNGRRIVKRINRLTGGVFRNCMCDNNTAPFNWVTILVWVAVEIGVKSHSNKSRKVAKVIWESPLTWWNTDNADQILKTKFTYGSFIFILPVSLCWTV